jgi:trehalose transport system substrate-binding protein
MVSSLAPVGWGRGRRRWRGPAALVGAAILLVLCAWGAREGTVISFAEQLEGAEKETVLELLHRFEIETGIRVAFVDLNRGPHLRERLEAGRRGGTSPIGVFAEDNVRLLPLLDEHLVEDLSGLPVPHVSESLVPPGEGGRYFLPFRPNVQVAYVSRKALAAAGVGRPTTVDDLAEVAERFKEVAGKGRVTLSLAPGDPAGVTIAELIRSSGGDPLTLDDAGSVEAFTRLQRMWRDQTLSPESLRARYDTQPVDLDTGESWLAQTWPFTSKMLASKGKLDDFEIYAGVGGTHVVGGDVLGVPRRLSKTQRKAAFALVEFLMSADSQRFLAKENAWPSIREDAYSRIWWGGCGGSRCPPWVTLHQVQYEDTLKAARQALQQDRWLRPSTEQWHQVSCAITTAVHRILERNEDVQTVLAELHGQVAGGVACRVRTDSP